MSAANIRIGPITKPGLEINHLVQPYVKNDERNKHNKNYNEKIVFKWFWNSWKRSVLNN